MSPIVNIKIAATSGDVVIPCHWAQRDIQRAVGSVEGVAATWSILGRRAGQGVAVVVCTTKAGDKYKIRVEEVV